MLCYMMKVDGIKVINQLMLKGMIFQDHLSGTDIIISSLKSGRKRTNQRQRHGKTQFFITGLEYIG